MIKTACIVLISLSFLMPRSVLALQDQGLNSIMEIIDRAINEFNVKSEERQGSEEGKQQANQAASATVVNLSRTLGKLSYSRLQCGQADVLAEFTQRVQKMPQDFRDPMREAFQEGFDQSKTETPLLSEDECNRLTQSRTRGDKQVDANITEENKRKKREEKEVVKKAPPPDEDPKLKHMRIAELSGQLAYRRKFCGDKKVISRDFNEVISKMPQPFQEEAKKSYWKGYKHGKRLNKGLTKEGCN